MANNIMFICHKPSGRNVAIAKRMDNGWYNVPTDLANQLDKFFTEIEEEEKKQDSFVIAMEYTEDNEPYVYTDWLYTKKNNRDLLLPEKSINT